MGFQMEFILERERKIPVKFRADVIVVGGGPAGLGAALAAAKNGAKTILVERYSCLGGLATTGLVIVLPPPPHGGTKGYGGLLQEIVNRLFELRAAHRFKKGEDSVGDIIFDPEALKLVVDQMVEEARVKLLLNSTAVDAVVKDNAIAGIIVENKSGRQAIMGKIVVDATGDGDIAAAAGAPYKKSKKYRALPTTLIYVIGGVNNHRVRKYQREDPELRKAAKKAGFTCYTWGLRREQRGPTFLHMDNIANGQVVVWGGSMQIDGTDAEDLTKAEIELRKRAKTDLDFLKKYIPGFEDSYIATTAPYIGVRETRRIVGEYVLNEEDLKKRRVFPDAIEWYESPITPHDMHNIPFRCLVPKGIDNLLVAGRCLSATHGAQNRTRDIPTCMAMGQAAGTAAALSVKQGVKPRQFDVGLLQKTLVEQGAYVKRA